MALYNGTADPWSSRDAVDAVRAELGSAHSIKTTATSFESPDGGEARAPSEHNIRVVVRVRPLMAHEQNYNYAQVVSVQDDSRTVLVDSGGAKAKSYAFDQVFAPSADQETVFNRSGVRELIDAAIDGYACTVLAFGQTGSGKTYTMTGPDGRMDGLLPRAIYYLYERLAAVADERTRFATQASYLEIYNEQVRDLLNLQSGVLPVRWNQQKDFYVENLYVVLAETLDDMIAVSVEGMRNRAQRAHDINEHSSRSHAIVTMYVTSETVDEAGGTVLRHGKISFVDLAGSERVKESQATGEGFTEAKHINQSLLTLGNCIAALTSPGASSSSSSGGGGGGSEPKHIPFRDSKLTKLLKDSLGGSGVTLMVACLSPHDLEESIKTLRYAARTKQIQNKPVVMMDPRDQLIAQLRREIGVLRRENAYLREQQQGALAGGGAGAAGRARPQAQVLQIGASAPPMALPAERAPAGPTRLPELRTAAAPHARQQGRGSLPPRKASGAAALVPDVRARPPSAFLQPHEALGRLAEAEAVIGEYMAENERVKAEVEHLTEWQAMMSREHGAAMRENDELRRRLQALEAHDAPAPVVRRPSMGVHADSALARGRGRGVPARPPAAMSTPSSSAGLQASPGSPAARQADVIPIADGTSAAAPALDRRIQASVSSNSKLREQARALLRN